MATGLNSVDPRFVVKEVPNTKELLRAFINQAISNDNFFISKSRLAQILGWMLDFTDGVGGGLDEVLTAGSIVGSGVLGDEVELDGDLVSPSDETFYGKRSGVKGWFAPLQVGEANVGLNLGGIPIYDSKLGTILRFKGLEEGTNISIVNNGNTLTINSTAVSGGSSAPTYHQIAGTGFNFQCEYIGDDVPTLGLVGSTFTLTTPVDTHILWFQIDSSFSGVGSTETVYLKVVNTNDSRYSVPDKVKMHNFLIYERDTFTTTPEGTGPLFEAEAGSKALASRTKFGVYDIDEIGNSITYQFLNFGTGKWSIVG